MYLVVEVAGGGTVPRSLWQTRAGVEAFVQSNPGTYRVYEITDNTVPETYNLRSTQ